MRYKSNDAGGESRTRLRINALDIIFIAVLLLIVLVAISYFTSFSLFGMGGDKKTIEYTVEFECVNETMADSIRIGDKAFDSSGKSTMGVVTAVSKKPAVRYIYDHESGVLREAELPAAADGSAQVALRVTMRVATDYISGEGLTVNGVRLSVGTPVRVGFTGYYGTGDCVSIYGVAAED